MQLRSDLVVIFVVVIFLFLVVIGRICRTGGRRGSRTDNVSAFAANDKEKHEDKEESGHFSSYVLGERVMVQDMHCARARVF